MALIWAKGFENEKALAPLWLQCALAEARSKDFSQPPAALGAAMIDAQNAKAAYAATSAMAEAALIDAANKNQALTHALVIGVGAYDSAGIKPLTTSVRGAWAFADWMLTRFEHPDRPLGSLEILLSPSGGLGPWQPSAEAAARLSLPGGVALPVEPAKLGNIKDAFTRWLMRAGALLGNSAFFYFSGHGVWKSVAILLPQDARLPSAGPSFENLIDIQQTERNMFNMPPSLQCFFIDSCQEITGALLQNLDAAPGEPLHRPVNRAAIERRDACLYLGSYTGRKAFGPENAAPFFTQELLHCLERRGAGVFDGDTWTVTTNSLRVALEASSSLRREQEKEDIQFSVAPGICTFTADVCQIKGPPEVFIKVWCLPTETMLQAKFYVESGGTRSERPIPLPGEWYTTVACGDCQAGVEFDAAIPLNGMMRNINAVPPLLPVLLRVPPREPAGAAPGGGS